MCWPLSDGYKSSKATGKNKTLCHRSWYWWPVNTVGAGVTYQHGYVLIILPEESRPKLTVVILVAIWSMSRRCLLFLTDRLLWLCIFHRCGNSHEVECLFHINENKQKTMEHWLMKSELQSWNELNWPSIWIEGYIECHVELSPVGLSINRNEWH